MVHYTAALFSYRGLQGLINSLIIASASTVLSTVLGTMMAYSLARFRTGGNHLAFWVISQRFLPPVAIILPIFLLFRTWGLYDTRIGTDPRLRVHDAAAVGVDDVRLFSPVAEVARGGGAGRRPQPLAGVLDGRDAARGAGRRSRGRLRLHRRLDRILLRPDPDQPLRVHAADDLSRLPRIPGRAIWRSLRACDRVARAVHRVGDAGAAASGARASRSARCEDRAWRAFG